MLRALRRPAEASSNVGFLNTAAFVQEQELMRGLVSWIPMPKPTYSDLKHSECKTCQLSYMDARSKNYAPLHHPVEFKIIKCMLGSSKLHTLLLVFLPAGIMSSVFL